MGLCNLTFKIIDQYYITQINKYQKMYKKLKDINMYYEDNQKEGCPVIFFIHGLGQNADSWRYQYDFFSQKNYRTIAVDLRGHGRTDQGQKQISITQFAEDICQFANELNLKPINFVGLSMGGIIAQKLGISYQKIVNSLTLCNTACFPSQQVKKKIEQRIKMINNHDMDYIANFIVQACLPVNYDKEVYDMAFNIFRKNRKNPYIQATKATFEIDFRNDLPKVTIPTLILTGQFDKTTPVSSSEIIQSLIPNSEMHVIKGVGHLSKLQNPKEFNRILFQFMQKRAKIVSQK